MRKMEEGLDMFDSKYSDILTVILVVVIIAIIGLLGFWAYDVYTRNNTDKDALNAINEFENNLPDKDKNTTNNIKTCPINIKNIQMASKRKSHLKIRHQKQW